MSQIGEVQEEVSESDNGRKNSTMTSEARKSKYRDLLDQVEILHENEDAGLQAAEVLDQILGNANVLFKDTSNKERIQHTDEVLLDAKVVGKASDVLLFITESVDCTLDSYDHLELGRKINSQLFDTENSNDTDYTELANIAQAILKLPPKFTYLYGEIGHVNREVKPVKERKQRVRQSQKEKQEAYLTRKQPAKVTEVSKEEDSVDDTVKFLQWALNKECEESNKNKLNYFIFVIDPSSFSKTIENMFHCSFLVRDGRAKIDHDSDGVIQIYPISGHDSKKIKKSGVKYKQSIMSMDVANWEALIKTFTIKKCFLSKWRSKWDSRKN